MEANTKEAGQYHHEKERILQATHGFHIVCLARRLTADGRSGNNGIRAWVNYEVLPGLKDSKVLTRPFSSSVQSCGVVSQPLLKRRTRAAAAGGKPIAASTWEGSSRPLAQAEPVETA